MYLPCCISNLYEMSMILLWWLFYIMFSFCLYKISVQQVSMVLLVNNDVTVMIPSRAAAHWAFARLRDVNLAGEESRATKVNGVPLLWKMLKNKDKRKQVRFGARTQNFTLDLRKFNSIKRNFNKNTLFSQLLGYSFLLSQCCTHNNKRIINANQTTLWQDQCIISSLYL